MRWGETIFSTCHKDYPNIFGGGISNVGTLAIANSTFLDLVYAGSLLPFRSQMSTALAGLTSGQFGFGQVGSGLTSDGFISVEDLMAVANAALGQYSVAVGGDSFRNYLLALAQSLQSVNTNNAFAQLSPALLAEVFASYALDELS